MINVKVYEYDSSQESNGYRGTDYSSHVTQGFQDIEDITQEMDTSEITLAGLDFNTEFDPETKFIIDVVNTDELGNDEIVETLHRVVARDFVQQPILSDDSYFDHHISFIEPSVIAQKRLVDNISITYKLKDVNLEETPAYPQAEITYGIQDSAFVPDRNITINSSSGLFSSSFNGDCAKYFELEGDLQITNTQGQVTNIYNNIENFNNGSAYVCNITFPKMAIYFGNEDAKTFTKLGYASIDYEILEYDLNNETNPTTIASASFISNSDLGNGHSVQLDNRLARYRNKINGEWLLEKVNKIIVNANGQGYAEYYFKKYTDKSATTPTYQLNNIPIQADKKYVINVSLHQFEDNIPSRIAPQDESQPLYKVHNDANPVYYTSLSSSWSSTSPTLQNFSRFIVNSLITNQTAYSFNFVTYGVDTKTIVYASSTPYSALALLQKAIINSGDYEKKANVYIADVNNSDLPYVIDSNYVDKLAATRIIENFYNQKNLWEIMVEVGHYIHAIPELRFGADDKFLITFNELGRTDQKQDYGTKVSIFNSRSVEDYISATSSYVSNMVQLGGYIEEWVAPKTSDETLLVSNDTSSIITTKPIIELLNVTVRANKDLSFSHFGVTNTIHAGDTADMTPFIYEENVYKILSLEYNVEPNRGIAMYYKLGTNEITGGQYQLPQANTNIYTDYAFKKIIYSAYFGYPADAPSEVSTRWYNLSVNDFTFFVRYRTKDSVRQDHVRPDLRKYLLNSKYDKVPQHNQFNNQQDVLVDSIKFGNNVYGKLIKTGNSEYTKTEWVTEYSALKHKGELYSIHGQLYYVANVTNTYYSSYILSEVKFSKDYNELSAVIGIPSEPRFYEISEQSSIKREKDLNAVVLLTAKDYTLDILPVYSNLGYNTYVEDLRHVTDLIFGGSTGTFAKYALTTYKGDKDSDKYDQTIGEPNFYKEVLTPINAYSSENTLTYEWDMIDNYSAGDKVIECDTPSNVHNDRYKSLQAVGYTDIYGKAPLMDFYLLRNIPDLNLSEIQALPESPLQTYGFYIGEVNSSGLALPSEGDSGNTYYGIHDYYQFTSVDDYVGYYIVTGLFTYELVTNDNKNNLGIIPGTTSAYDTFNNFIYKNTGRSPEIGDIIKFNWFGFFGNVLDTYIYSLVKDNGLSNSTKWERKKIDDTFITPTQKFLGNYADNIIATNKHNYDSDYNGKGLGLLKDCRETISINYNIQLVTDSDQFVLSPFLFLPNKTGVKMVLLNTEVNKLSDGYIDVSSILTPKDSNGNDMNPYFDMPTTFSYGRSSGWDSEISLLWKTSYRISTRLENVNENHFNGTEGYEQVKAIAFICNVNINPDLDTDGTTQIPYKQQFIIARNLPANIGKSNGTRNWTFGSPSKSLYRNKQ